MESVKSIIEVTYGSSKMIDRAYYLSNKVNLDDFIQHSLGMKTLPANQIIDFIMERTEITIKKCTQLQERLVELKNGH